jgi:hypothetical protein
VGSGGLGICWWEAASARGFWLVLWLDDAVGLYRKVRRDVIGGSGGRADR